MTATPVDIAGPDRVDVAGWAWAQVGRFPAGGGAGTHLRLTLLAVARHAEEAMNSPAGYWWTTPADVARLVGLAPSTVAGHLRHLADLGMLVRTSDLARRGAQVQRSTVAYRVPEHVLQGTEA